MNTYKQLLPFFALVLVGLGGCVQSGKQGSKQQQQQEQQQDRQQGRQFLPTQNNQNKQDSKTKVGGGKEDGSKEEDGKDGAAEKEETQQEDKGSKEDTNQDNKEDTNQDNKEDTNQDNKEQASKDNDKDEQQTDKDDKGSTDPVPTIDPQATAYAAFYRKHSGSLKVIVAITANTDKARLNSARGWFKDFKAKLDNDSDKLSTDGVGIDFSLNFNTRIEVNSGWYYCASGELDSKKHTLTQDERRTWLSHNVVTAKFAKLTTRSAKAGEDCSQ